MPPTVKRSDIAFSFTKPRFSSSPYTMFRVSKSDFIAALALQSETPRPTRNEGPRALRGDARGSRPFVFCCGQCDLVRLKDDSAASRNDSEGFAS